jgi:hypothetical protein
LHNGICLINLLWDRGIRLWDLEIREFFLDLDRVLHTQSEIRNTDGDPMEFHKICYDLDVISDLESMMREFIADVRQRLKLDRPPETRRGANTRDDPT